MQGAKFASEKKNYYKMAKKETTKKAAGAEKDPRAARLEALAQAMGRIEKAYGRSSWNWCQMKRRQLSVRASPGYASAPRSSAATAARSAASPRSSF